MFQNWIVDQSAARNFTVNEVTSCEGEPSEDVVGSYYQVELLFQSCDSIPKNIPNNTTSSPDGSYLHVSKKKSISRKQRLNFDFWFYDFDSMVSDFDFVDKSCK